MEALEYTTYLEDSCRKLAKFGEYSTDVVATHLVLLQRLRLKICRSFDQPDDSIKFDRLSTKMWLNILQTELEDFHKNLPNDIKKKCKFINTPKRLSGAHFSDQRPATIATGYHAATISLYEASLYDTQCHDLEKSQRIRMLSMCLLGVKDFFTSRSATHTPSFPALSLVSWTHYGYALLMALKLSLLKVDGWDLGQVRDEIQLPGILEETVSLLEPITKQRKQVQTGNRVSTVHVFDERDIFNRFIRQMRRMKSLYITTITAHAGANVVPGPPSPATPQTMASSAITSGPTFIEGLALDVMLPDFDQSFWQDMYHNDDDPWTTLNWDGQGIT